ncbi:MAG: hypothetical protein N2Z21_07660 [Candidatus Sumerlaeaceae bacterium]|nr:hypothetical protein [Candidatus Sumerlaeaceae bacterium]
MRCWLIHFLSALAFGLVTATLASPGGGLPSQLNLPPRPADAPTGSQLSSLLAPLSLEEREERIWSEVVRGNVPSFLRALVPVEIEANVGDKVSSAVVVVTPDYFALGSDSDFFRLPMTPQLAQWICDYLDCSLPTPKLVNEIWTNAAAQLMPQPIPPSPEMANVEVFYQHHLMVETQRVAKGFAVGLLMAGIKKDVVLTPQLARRPPPPRVAIYGWHYPNGTPIQPVSLVHKAYYADYSHGIRLVANNMLVNGRAARLPNLLRTPQMATLLSDEGHFETQPRYPLEKMPPATSFWDLELLP